MTSPGERTILEPSRELKVCHETEVLVVGGGPAGVAAAIASARNGAATTLVERYNHLGGMATGGLVILIPNMSAGTEEQEIAGICDEMMQRVDAKGGARHPQRRHLGSDDPQLTEELKHYHDFVVDGRVRMSVIVDPELLKCVLNEMVEEAGVKLYLHSWAGRALVDGDHVQGIAFESKSGRQAILSRTTIDTTGDGDILATAGAEFDGVVDPNLRCAAVAVVWRMDDVDFPKYSEFRHSEPEAFKALLDEMREAAGFAVFPLPTHRDDQVWVNNWVLGRDCLDVDDITWTEVAVRKAMLKVVDILKRKMPGFETSFILDTASQLGTRGSRRLVGEHVVTEEDVRSGVVFPDTIAMIPPFHIKTPPKAIPYRSLVPVKVEDLLVAGRCFSSDPFANDLLNLIPFCVAMGEAAGTAAAIALRDGVQPRAVDTGKVQRQLVEQGVWLPKELRG
ncbi:MAG: FAD-dependent oxidoreductase [Thermoleophilia bacterium]|nr:FAD-dependent oxidoreductase [Thermoleophilia bacterium]